MKISVSEFKNDFDNYLALSATEDVYIAENGKIIAKLSNPFQERVDMAKSLFGILPANAMLEEGTCDEEYDITVAEKSYAEYVEGGRKSRPISELWKELD